VIGDGRELVMPDWLLVLVCTAGRQIAQHKVLSATSCTALAVGIGVFLLLVYGSQANQQKQCGARDREWRSPAENGMCDNGLFNAECDWDQGQCTGNVARCQTNNTCIGLHQCQCSIDGEGTLIKCSTNATCW
jgi:hypothetical protein